MYYQVVASRDGSLHPCPTVCVMPKHSVWFGIAVCKHTESVNVEMKFLKRFVTISASYTSCIVWVKLYNLCRV